METILTIYGNNHDYIWKQSWLHGSSTNLTRHLPFSCLPSLQKMSEHILNAITLLMCRLGMIWTISENTGWAMRDVTMSQQILRLQWPSYGTELLYYLCRWVTSFRCISCSTRPLKYASLRLCMTASIELRLVASWLESLKFGNYPQKCSPSLHVPSYTQSSSVLGI
jgi:hypothetical protein